MSVDVSANLLVYETLNLGVNNRWDDFISTQRGLEYSTRFNTSYANDYGINELNE